MALAVLLIGRTWVAAQQDSKDAQEETKSEKTDYFEISYFPLSKNSYSIGNGVTNWMNDYLQGGGGVGFDSDNSSSYMQSLQLDYLHAMNGAGDFLLGLGLTADILPTVPPPTTGNLPSGQLYWYNDPFVYNPYVSASIEPSIFSVDVPMRWTSDAGGTGFAFGFVPSIVIGSVSGQANWYYNGSLTSLNITGSGVGGGAAVTTGYYWKYFGLVAEAGYRLLSMDLGPGGGYNNYTVDGTSGGKAVSLDLSGGYVLIGATARFGFRS